METFSALLAICAGNSPVPGEFPAQRPVTRSFYVFFNLRLNKRLSNNREAGDLRRHRGHFDVIVMLWKNQDGCKRRNVIVWNKITSVIYHAYTDWFCFPLCCKRHFVIYQWAELWFGYIVLLSSYDFLFMHVTNKTVLARSRLNNTCLWRMPLHLKFLFGCAFW